MKKLFPFALIVLVAVGVYFIFKVTGHTNRLVIDFIGDMVCSNEQQITDSLKKDITKIKNLRIQFMLSGEKDRFYDQKALLEMASVGVVDVFVLDARQYRRFAKEGVFIPLDEYLVDLGTTYEANEFLLEKHVELGVDGEILSEVGPHIYGVDVTNSTYLKENSITGIKMIATIRNKTKNQEKAKEVLKLLIP